MDMMCDKCLTLLYLSLPHKRPLPTALCHLAFEMDVTAPPLLQLSIKAAWASSYEGREEEGFHMNKHECAKKQKLKNKRPCDVTP